MIIAALAGGSAMDRRGIEDSNAERSSATGRILDTAMCAETDLHLGFTNGIVPYDNL